MSLSNSEQMHTDGAVEGESWGSEQNLSPTCCCSSIAACLLAICDSREERGPRLKRAVKGEGVPSGILGLSHLRGRPIRFTAVLIPWS